MKTKFVILLSLSALQLAISQNYQTVDDLDVICSDLGFMGNQEADFAVDQILNQIGLFKNFTIQECPNINNAIAKNIDMGQGKTARFILYDVSFFDRISNKAANDWAATSILAHEIGHHLNGHALNDQGSNHKWELEADEFSGFVLARMGSTLEDAQSALLTIKYEKATRTHPAKVDRLNAVQKGWNRGSIGKVVVSNIDIKEDLPNNGGKGNSANHEVELTPEQVLSKFINALGGEQAVMQIKTMVQEADSNTVLESEGKSTEFAFTSRTKQISPLTMIVSFLEPGTANIFQENLYTPKVIYERSNPEEDWRVQSYFVETRNIC